ncbi:MAG: CGNR zinc finger domain-containing protein [Anaerovoracaceae bacterium]
MKNISDFFINNLFEYENCTCVCQKETVYTTPNEPPHFNLKLCSVPENVIRFSYAPQKGLNQSGNAGGVISENILGQLLAIPIGDVDATVAFFERYGFLFPISDEQYECIDDNALLEILNRIKATVMLMSTIAGKRDYKKMLICATYLLFSNPVQFTLSTHEYDTTNNHPFTKLIHEYNMMPDLNRNQELFDNQYISIEDTIVNGYNKIYVDELAGMDTGDGISGLPGSRDWHFKNLFALYTNYPFANTSLRTIIDFYYHYETKVGVFSNVEVNRITYHTDPERDKFTDEMKVALLKIAKIVISEEINANLQGISPQIVPETLSPAWKLNSLLEALYFSIFYMKPGVELYKECQNPNCKHQKYFLINATVTNKKYCCPACGNAAAQRRSRQRKLSNK